MKLRFKILLLLIFSYQMSLAPTLSDFFNKTEAKKCVFLISAGLISKVIMHELGHVIAMKFLHNISIELGIIVRKRFPFLSIFASGEPRYKIVNSWKKEAIISVSGPILDIITMKIFKDYFLPKIIRDPHLNNIFSRFFNLLIFDMLFYGFSPISGTDSDGFKLWELFVNDITLKKFSFCNAYNVCFNGFLLYYGLKIQFYILDKFLNPQRYSL